MNPHIVEGYLPFTSLRLDPEDISLPMGVGYVSDTEMRAMYRTLEEEITGIYIPRFLYILFDSEPADTCEVKVSRTCLKMGAVITPYLKDVAGYAFFVTATGREFETSQRGTCVWGDILREFLLDACGSAAAEAVIHEMCWKVGTQMFALGHGANHPYSPGYYGWHITQQQLLFSCLPESPCGIRLGGSSLMSPVKSVSGILAYGPRMAKWRYGYELCGKTDCYRNRNKLKRQNAMELSQYIEDKLMSERRMAIPIMTHPGIKLLGKRVLDTVTNEEVHYHIIRALNKCFPQSVACTTIMDLTVETKVFGTQLSMLSNEVSSVSGRLLAGYANAEVLQVPSLEPRYVPQYLQADRLTVKGIDKPVLAGCTGPYSLAGYLYDMTEIMTAIYVEPETARLLLEKCTELILRYCPAIKETGVIGVVMAEPATGLLSNEDCLQHSSVYIEHIIDTVQDGSFTVILHNCDNTGYCTPAMLVIGAQGYRFGSKTDVLAALRECPSDIWVIGNLDLVGVFRVLTPGETFTQTEGLLSRTGGYTNFIVSTGCDTSPEILFDNAQAFYLAVERCNKGR